MLCIFVCHGSIEADVEVIIPEAVCPAPHEDLVQLVEEVVALLAELVQEEEGLERESSSTLWGGGEGGGWEKISCK